MPIKNRDLKQRMMQSGGGQGNCPMMNEAKRQTEGKSCAACPYADTCPDCPRAVK